MPSETRTEAPISTHEACEILGVAPQTLANWRWQRKNLPFIRSRSGRVLYRRSDVEDFRDHRNSGEVVEVDRG